MATSDVSLLRAVVNHVVLPPDVPGSIDRNLFEINRDLLRRLQNACSELQEQTKGEFQKELDLLHTSLDHCQSIHASQYLDSTLLQVAFRKLQDGETLIIYVIEQNAGLLVQHGTGELKGHIKFEAFEVSPKSEKVLESQRALRWDFPTSAAAIPRDVFDDVEFQRNLAEFLEKASRESIKKFGAVTKKAKSSAFEPRDTVNPALITGMLVTLLEGIGKLVTTQPTQKRIRDEVRWKDSLIPWRRSPFWLLLRVGTLRHLENLTNPTVSNALYKALICLLHAGLLDRAAGSLSPDVSHLLMTKLCRRLAKLEKDKVLAAADGKVSRAYGILLEKLRPRFLQSTKGASNRLLFAWEGYKMKIQRPITQLRTRQAGIMHLTVSLPNSLPYFERLRQERPVKSVPSSAYVMPPNLVKFLKKYTDLAEAESTTTQKEETTDACEGTWEHDCLELANQIESYLTKSAASYEIGTEDRSFMVLTAMWLWMLMDQLLCKFTPAFRLFKPVFQPDVLDCLRLSGYQDVCRLQRIQGYLRNRASATHPSLQQTVFDNPNSGCFAERYYEWLPSDSEVHKLYRNIQQVEQDEMREKENEWGELDAKHQRILKEIAITPCQYTLVGELLIPEHDEQKCRKCILTRKADRIRIERIEKPMPDRRGEATAVLFELLRPASYAAYRDATWSIVATLGLPNIQETRKEPSTTVRGYYSRVCPELPHHSKKGGITLASKSKSFLQTHFRFVGFPIPFNKVLVHNGLKFEHYDASWKVWPAEHLHEITFKHHCAFAFPPRNPFFKIEFPSRISLQERSTGQANNAGNFCFHGAARYLTADAEVTSNEILAGLPRCPQSLGISEFMAFQGLICGSYRLWPSILVELGSSNLNFSAEAVVILTRALQCRTGSEPQDEFHAANMAFRDEFFCNSLLAQVKQRLLGIQSNWRENYSMEILISFILKLFTLGNEDTSKKALELLEVAREITVQWIRILRKEFWSATDTHSSEKLSRFTLWAALLCRRTFAGLSAQDYQPKGRSKFRVNGPSMSDESSLCSSALSTFCEASISLQENLPVEFEKISPLLRSVLIRDIKMIVRLRKVLQLSLLKNPKALILAAVKAEAMTKESLLCRYEPYSIEDRHDAWVKVGLSSRPNLESQTIEFHLVAGSFIINGRTVEREVPSRVRQAEGILRLFPYQRLIVYPSPIPGMSYKVGFNIEDHEIHLGFRQSALVIRAWNQNALLEYIPSSIFERGPSFDLPASLIENCVHWLNLSSNIVEVRKAPKIWRSVPSNWCINLHTRMVERRGSRLVDPQSHLFNHFASMFRGFEDPRHITVYQPRYGALSVELRRYELFFFVNVNRFLESQQLRAEIDENQDMGTWYGLSSKIVLRDIQNPRHRSVIVPLGPLQARRQGMHVEVEIQRTDPVYGRFFLDDLLGRVTCASEPRLFYTKALLHAYTSFSLPDPLTRRTGTEEARHILQSGGCQPYAPLSEGSTSLLDQIAKLTPERHFYPPELQVLEIVSWNDDLTICMQDDGFPLLVDAIKRKSDFLARFGIKDEIVAGIQQGVNHQAEGNLKSPSNHLTQRSQGRRQLYHRPQIHCHNTDSPSDYVYAVRGYGDCDQDQDHVFQAVRLLYQWPTKLPSPTLLHLMLQNWPYILGYGDGTVIYDRTRLSDQLDADLASSFGPLVNLYRLSTKAAKYKLMFLSALICFREEINMRAIQTLIAFAVFEDLKVIDLPSWPSYTQFRPGFCPKAEYLKRLLHSSQIQFIDGGPKTTQRERKGVDAARRLHDIKVTEGVEALVDFICAQWPCPLPSLQSFQSSVLDLEKALALIAVEWHTMFQNHEFEEHLRQVQEVLDKHRTTPPARVRTVTSKASKACPWRGFPMVCAHLLDKEGPTIRLQDTKTKVGGGSPVQKTAMQSKNLDINELRRILDELPVTRSVVRQEYIKGLRQSITALESHRRNPVQESQPIDISRLNDLIQNADDVVNMRFGQLCFAFEKDEPGATWLQVGNIWPVATHLAVLETLRSTYHVQLKKSMRDAITEFGTALAQLQRLLRVQDAVVRRKTQQVKDELRNPGHTNWDPKQYPDWLLFEIDSNILIRRVQASVAFAIISPASGSNSVLQLNMGQGKTSVIIPLVISVLANGKSLCRVVVPKALLLQTAQLLQSRLGGLLNRELRHIPFSRRTPCSPEMIKLYRDIHKDVLTSSGVVLALPEHMMSFMLSGQQRLLDGKILEATQMVKVQKWLSTKSRDVFDESDFTMAVRTQLIYPSGPQVTVDGGNCRWETIQTVLKLTESHLHGLERLYESSIQVVRRETGGFPFIYFLRTDVQDALMQCLVSDICGGRTPLLNMDNFSAFERQAIKAFVTEATPERRITSCISDIHRSCPTDACTIYLLRGLLLHRILILTLSRRWNVQYGLHPLRDPVAVPFLAKGIPSNLSEWGHVDVAILFTCLSFYYQGLSSAQLRQSLGQILKSDDPAREYEQWTQGSTRLSDRHRDWTSINLEDPSQLAEIWQGVRHNTSAIDYFLNNFVFPKHAKQFKVKLQASGWDLPLNGIGSTLTTGFSGTNDNRVVLPLTIKQDDLKSLAHTNAEVLTMLLDGRNREYTLAGWRIVLNGRPVYRRMSEGDLLKKLYHRGIRVLIDAGALVLEMTNLTLAKMWLDIDIQASAAVFFDDENKPTVLSRSGRKVPLLASPYADDLRNCLVYLDESHTRGTDMKFPPDACGAVTLSLGQTKDQTVQAVMRLRQLATTQSVTFFAPPEVHQSILDFRNNGENMHIDSHDVLCWLLQQTSQGLENLQPLYYAQGVSYCRRTQANRNHTEYLSDPAQRHAYMNALQDLEQQSLKSLYEPRAEKAKKSVRDECFDGKIANYINDLEQRRKAFQDTGNAVHASALQEVEQEREVAVEAETIRERQNPVHFHPHSFSGLSDELREFVIKGTLRPDDKICESAFSYMTRSATAQKYPADLPTTPNLLISAEFRKTVWIPSGKVNDDFLRPVQWILWSRSSEVAILVSPEEAEELIPLCRSAAKQVVHLLTYAAPVTQKMLQFNDLNYYSVPSLPSNWSAPLWLKVQIGIFSGRLYFPFDELKHIRAFLGLEDDQVTQYRNPIFIADEDEEVPVDNSDASDQSQKQPSAEDEEKHLREAREVRKVRNAKIKSTKMLTFLHAWLGVRGRGQDFTHTPMGYICARKLLTDDHPFFRVVGVEETTRSRFAHATGEGDAEHVHAHVGAEEDDNSAVDEDELHERQKLTREELTRSEEISEEHDIAGDDDESESEEC